MRHIQNEQLKPNLGAQFLRKSHDISSKSEDSLISRFLHILRNLTINSRGLLAGTSLQTISAIFLAKCICCHWDWKELCLHDYRNLFIAAECTFFLAEITENVEWNFLDKFNEYSF